MGAMMKSLICGNSTDAHYGKCFAEAEKELGSLLATADLDYALLANPRLANNFEKALNSALGLVYDGSAGHDPSHLFLQRVLYRINRLKFFWYDDLRNYENERSGYLIGIRNRIEAAWTPWELSQLAIPATGNAEVASALRLRAARDVAPPPSPEGIYFRDQLSMAGYRKLLEIASLDGLVEASQLSRTLGGVSNEIHAMMTRLLVEEYGGGRLSRKHSSFFSVMLAELGISARPEAFFDVVPWEVLANINHSFLLSERKRFFLRYVGGLLYTEISVPATFENYRLAAERLGMSEKARGYWDLHIKEDERHGRWMLNDVALPLAGMYPGNASELVLGYDQQKFMSDRAGRAVAAAVKHADLMAHVPVCAASLEAAA